MQIDEPRPRGARTFLSGFAYEVGERERLVAQVPEVAADPKMLAAVEEIGLRHYRESDRTPFELALPSAARTLRESGISPADVDTIVYATSSFTHAEYYSTPSISRFLRALELEHAYPIGTFLSGCGNIMTALRLGDSLLRSGASNTLLVVVADRRKTEMSPLVWLGGSINPAKDGWSVTSDGASTFVMSAKPAPGLELLGVQQHMLAAVGESYREADPVSLLVRLGRGFRSSIDALLQRTGCSARDVAHFLPNTMNVRGAHQLARLMGFPLQAMYLDRVPAYGHIRGGTDVVAALTDLFAGGRIGSGELVLSLANGHSMWGVAAFRAT